MSETNPEHVVLTTPDAPWLPPGSSAEVWSGEECVNFEPAVIVRLLLVRQAEAGPEFFTVPTVKGDDLPTLHLGPEDERMGTRDGVRQLLCSTIGQGNADTRCVGYVRNVVPAPDATYPHPTPWAHVPIFLVEGEAAPILEGRWHTLESARPALESRHWWPVVNDRLGRQC